MERASVRIAYRGPLHVPLRPGQPPNSSRPLSAWSRSA